jgi:hypothetical protein
MMKKFLLLILIFSFGTFVLSQSSDAGKLKFVKFQDSNFDQFTSNPDANMVNFLNQKFERMVTYTTYFDLKVSLLRC